jgi:dihydrofolate reductase
VTRTVYYTATTLDGFIADEDDSLQWLFDQEEPDGEGPSGYDSFIAGIGAIAMGATTYEWVRAHLDSSGEAWPYDLPCWVFTHRDLPSVAEGVRFATGDVREHHAAMAEAAGERGIWVAGGGDLAGQFADHGLLDQVVVSIAGVTLGAGRPLFPRRFDLTLVETGRNGGFVVATYDVKGRRSD